MNVPTISPQSLHELVQAGREVELIDVRTPKEFQEIHASLARNEPLDRLDPKRLAARGAAGWSAGCAVAPAVGRAPVRHAARARTAAP